MKTALKVMGILLMATATVSVGVVFAQLDPPPLPQDEGMIHQTPITMTDVNGTVILTLNLPNPEPEPDHMVAVYIGASAGAVSCPGTNATYPAMSHPKATVWDETPHNAFLIDGAAFDHNGHMALGYGAVDAGVLTTDMHMLIHTVDVDNDTYTVTGIGHIHRIPVCLNSPTADQSRVVPLTITGTCDGSELLLTTTPNNFNYSVTDIHAACISD